MGIRMTDDLNEWERLHTIPDGALEIYISTNGDLIVRKTSRRQQINIGNINQMPKSYKDGSLLIANHNYYLDIK